MKHAILLLFHQDIQQLERLISCFDDDFNFYIHIDKKYKISKLEIDKLREMSQVAKVYSKYKVNWGGFNIVRAQLYLLKEIVKDKSIDYIHFMSGQDYPIKSINYIRNFFELNKGKEFIEVMDLPNYKWDKGTYDRFSYYRLFDCFNHRCNLGRLVIDLFVEIQIYLKYKRSIPNYYDHLYGGSNWMSITRECAEYITNNYNRNFYSRLKMTFAPDETFFHTVILNSHFKDKIVNNNYRYIIWKFRNHSIPAVMDETDWKDILMSDALFVRKIDKNISNNLLDLIDKYLLNNATLSVSNKVKWYEKSILGYPFDHSLGSALLKILSLIEVKKVANFGCGPGWYVVLLLKNKYLVKGYDNDHNVEKFTSILFQNRFYCQYIDLIKEVMFEQKYDIGICLEAEKYIHIGNNNKFINNLINNSSRYIIFSGEKNIDNEHIHNDIISKFHKSGFYLNTPISNYLKRSASIKAYKENIMFFEKHNNTPIDGGEV